MLTYKELNDLLLKAGYWLGNDYRGYYIRKSGSTKTEVIGTSLMQAYAYYMNEIQGGY